MKVNTMEDSKNVNDITLEMLIIKLKLVVMSRITL